MRRNVGAAQKWYSVLLVDGSDVTCSDHNLLALPRTVFPPSKHTDPMCIDGVPGLLDRDACCPLICGECGGAN